MSKKTLTVVFDVTNLTQNQIDYLTYSVEVQGEDVPHWNDPEELDLAHTSDATVLSTKVEDK